jgi:excisionase family DNA binding protein
MPIETPDRLELNTQHRAEILTAAETARELRVSKAFVHNLINGKVPGALPLPSITLGRRRLIRRASLNQWLRANEHTISGCRR